MVDEKLQAFPRRLIDVHVEVRESDNGFRMGFEILLNGDIRVSLDELELAEVRDRTLLLVISQDLFEELLVPLGDVVRPDVNDVGIAVLVMR